MSRYSVSRRKINNNCQECGKELRIQAAKYCSYDCQQDARFKKKIIEIEAGLVASTSTSVKKLLEQRYGLKCSRCQSHEWQGELIPLDVDHIDGDPSNNRFDNLRFLCPNCHRLTDSWGNSAFKRQLKEQGKPGRIVNGSLVK
jgi:5-methylcytosine-specific restriction endonuclease McrA